MKDISDFILTNLAKVGRAKVKVSHVDLAQLDIPEPKFKEINTTVPSMRLDCLASSGFGYSRNKILPFIPRRQVICKLGTNDQARFSSKRGRYYYPKRGRQDQNF